MIVCVTGPECSGKSTLADALASRYNLPLVTEAARTFVTARGGVYNAADVLDLANQQAAAELSALNTHRHTLIIADTDLMVIKIWWLEKFGPLPAALRTGLAQRTPRHYLLVSPEPLWEDDGIRENPDDRARLYRRYMREHSLDSWPFDVISGDENARLALAGIYLERIALMSGLTLSQPG